MGLKYGRFDICSGIFEINLEYFGLDRVVIASSEIDKFSRG